MNTKQLKKALKVKNKKEKTKSFLSTGSTMLNLALTDNVNKGFATGHYYFIVGDSKSGKTFVALTCLAEASINSKFDKHRLIYDNNEDGALMDIGRFFGKKLQQRLEPPAKDKNNNPIYSQLVEQFYYNLDDALKDGRPFIYILDSQDCLSSKEVLDKFKDKKKAFYKEKEITGSYTDGKPKVHSQYLNNVVGELSGTENILIITAQTRDNFVGWESKSRSGGHALRFYASAEFWSSILKTIKKNIKGKDRQLGIITKIQVKKNRITGKERIVEVPIYHSHGIDDVGSCIDYLISEGHWKQNAGIVKAPEFKWDGKKEKLIRHIEENSLEKDLKEIVNDVWNEVEAMCKVKRKNKYE